MLIIYIPIPCVPNVWNRTCYFKTIQTKSIKFNMPSIGFATDKQHATSHSYLKKKFTIVS